MPESARGKAPPYMVRDEPDSTERSSELAQVIGKLHAASLAVLPVHQFLQGDLQRVLNSSNQDYTASVQEGTTMVAGETLPMEWQSLSSPRGNSGDKVRCIPVTPQGSDGVPTTTGHVVYPQQKFGSANLLEKAKELLLASWRSKTL